ncbi:MAG: methyltransferase domain-containing protein [Panacagrimonas sp.]
MRFVTVIWDRVRPYVPIQLYPLLSPIYRLRRRAQLRVMETADREYLQSHPDLRIPPAELRYNVVGPCSIPQFLRTGGAIVTDIEAALNSVGRSLAAPGRLLDFGCGCGRLLLALRKQKYPLKVTACDVDAKAIEWCRTGVDDVQCLTTSEFPPLPFPDESFDVIWCGSVFTHLGQTHQDPWLVELNRVLSANGVLLASVHGERAWAPRLPAWTIGKLQRRGMLAAKTGADRGVHPAWYQVAWHTETYVREHWGAYVEVRQYLPQQLGKFQDIVVATKRR